LVAEDVYNPNNEKFVSVVSSDFSIIPNTLTLPANSSFSSDSTTQRIFFFTIATMYCIEDAGDGSAELVRYEVGARDATGNPTTLENKAVIAENLLLSDSSFDVAGPSRTSNSVAEVRLVFSKNFETIAFNNEVHFPNVP
jgi:hypothetical protein